MKKTHTPVADIRKEDPKKIQASIADLKLKYHELLNKLYMGKLKNLSELKEVRKAIARYNTVKTEKVILMEVENGEG